jgi:hypothetical protein
VLDTFSCSPENNNIQEDPFHLLKNIIIVSRVWTVHRCIWMNAEYTYLLWTQPTGAVLEYTSIRYTSSLCFTMLYT